MSTDTKAPNSVRRLPSFAQTLRDEADKCDLFGINRPAELLRDAAAIIAEAQPAALSPGENGRAHSDRVCAAAETRPNCGACPGDGTVCPQSCRLAEESPRTAQQPDHIPEAGKMVQPAAVPQGATHYQPHQKAYYQRVSATEWRLWSDRYGWMPSKGTSDSSQWVTLEQIAAAPAAPAPVTLTDEEIIDIGNETHRAMPAGADDQDELLAIVRACLERAKGIGGRGMSTMPEPWGRDDLMALAAVRYCLGRMSYIVVDCCAWLRTAWPHLSPSIHKIIARDVDEAFARDDEARERGDQYKPLGMDMDRAQWAAVRGLWIGGEA